MIVSYFSCDPCDLKVGNPVDACYSHTFLIARQSMTCEQLRCLAVCYFSIKQFVMWTLEPFRGKTSLDVCRKSGASASLFTSPFR